MPSNTKIIADLNGIDDHPVIVVIDKVTHINAENAQDTVVHFVSGKVAIVKGTVSDIAAKLWPTD